MKKLSSLINLSALFIAIALLFIACSSNNSSPANSIAPNSGSSTASPANQFTGNLDTLFLTIQDFKKIQRRVVFRFYINDSAQLTLHGWFAKGVKTQKWTFSPNHDLTLSMGRQSTVIYGPRDYFGDLILHDSNLSTIDSLITVYQSKYVLFAPLDPAQAPFPGQITYSILLTSDDPHPLVNLAGSSVKATGVITNPCPPGSGE
jgi:hypothetical protein